MYVLQVLNLLVPEGLVLVVGTYVSHGEAGRVNS